VPAELVGGDFYDFLPLFDGQTFGAAIADASGHGLLAALLVRDVYVGLRMGIGGEFKISRAIERLNRIINKSRLTTKFVSLFYGEFDHNGEIIYVNAGHPGPLHLHSARHAFSELESTGIVLGPSPDAIYGRRSAKMDPGDVMLLYTDGIVEAHDRRGREFGLARVKRLLWELRGQAAKEIGEQILAAVNEWGSGAAAEDDRTVVIVKRALPVRRAASASGSFPAVR
jgi:serine phosphatase RsbU (regulator of sigma subunit)